ncbi:MAG TPA: DUF5309 family protein [Candidatus Krumholzibacteria bacterium]|nr:DUF5309 family protein [Candidatus Krumholzibacteria bacterium]
MAAPETNTYQTYQAKGGKEDVSDIISRISPEDTPYTSNVGSGKARNTFHEVLQDSLRAADTTNAQIEGFVVSHTARAPVARVGNYTQIIAGDVIVSGSLEVQDKYGRDSEMAFQKAKIGAELKRDAEAICLRNGGAVAGDSATARQTAGLPAWIKSNTVFESAGADPVYTNIPTAARTDGTADAFEEVDIKEGMREAYTNGGKPKMLLVGPFNKDAFGTFTGVATKTFYQSAVAETKIIGAADVYVSSFGNLAVVPSLFQRGRDAFGIDPELCELSWYRPYFFKPLGDTGDADRGVIIGEFANTVKNEAGIFGIYDLTTS